MMMATLSVARSWILLLFLAVRFSTAIPSITFPLNSQVPPVARIGQPFSFVFSQSTFTSPLAITYSLANPPAWLSIDSAARRLFGTPQDADVPAGDVVGVPVTLIATDETGSATLDATLVVSRESPPNLEIPIDEQIPKFGIFSSPSSILAPPDAPFSFQVYSDTFTNPSSHPLNYYAITLDHTPLPAWVSFDPATLTFTGRTPPFESLIQPPQAFGLQLVASDVEGFSAASLDFTIVVGNNQITASQTIIVLNATAGEPILYTGLRDGVQVDGQPATPENSQIKSTSNLPPWLTLDTTTWQISGTPPSDTADSSTSTSFTVTLGDMFSDTLNITFILESSSTGQGQNTTTHHTLLNGRLPIIDITPGEEFAFDLRPYLAHPEDTEMSVTGDLPTDLPSWIQVNPAGKTISGLVPSTSIESTLIEITINLKSKTSDITDSTQLTLEVVEESVSSTTSAVATQPSESSTTSSIKAPVSEDDPGNSPPTPPVNTKLLAILLPLLLLLIIAILVFIWWYRRRRRERQEPSFTREISEPLPGSFVVTAHGLPGSESHRQLEEQRSRTPSINNGNNKNNFNNATAVMDHEKKDPIETRSIYPSTEGDLMVRPLSTVRLIPSTERLRQAASNLLAKGRAASLGSRSAMSSRRGRPRRGNSTLSSISETTSHLLDGSLGMMGERRFLELPKHNGSASSFRGDIEINIPALRDPSAPRESTYTGEDDESNWTDAPYASSPPGSSRGNGDEDDTRHSVSDRSCEGPDVMPLRTVSRLGNYPTAPPTQKFSWPWNKRTASGRGSKVSFFSSRNGNGSVFTGVVGGKRYVSQQASIRSSPSTIDTFARQRRGGPNSRSKQPTANSSNGNRNNRDSNTTAGISFSQVSFPRTPTLPELPVLPSLIRPVTRRGEEAPGTDDDEEDEEYDRRSVRSSIIPGTIKTTTTTAGGNDIIGGGGGRKRATTLDTNHTMTRDSIYTTAGATDNTNDNDPVSPVKKKNKKSSLFISERPIWGASAATKGHSHDSLGIIYSDLVKRAPFHPSSSGFWSSAASTPVKDTKGGAKGKGKGKEEAADDSSGILPPNWAVMGGGGGGGVDVDVGSSPPPIIKGWGASSPAGGGGDGDGDSVLDDSGDFLRMQQRGSPIKSPGLPSLSTAGGGAGSRMGSGGLRLVEPSSSVRGPPSEADVMSVNTVDYWKGRAGGVGEREGGKVGGATSTVGPGSSVMSIRSDDDNNNHQDSTGTGTTTYWNKLGGRMFSRGDGVSWTADLGKYSSTSRVKKSSKGKGKGRRGDAGSISRVSIISEGNNNGKDNDNDNMKDKDKDAAAAVSLASASKSSVGGSHYYI